MGNICSEQIILKTTQIQQSSITSSQADPCIDSKVYSSTSDSDNVSIKTSGAELSLTKIIKGNSGNDLAIGVSGNETNQPSLDESGSAYSFSILGKKPVNASIEDLAGKWGYIRLEAAISPWDSTLY